ncbi:MAG: entericidin A/B family lipoprotein [Acinetobacter sp.]
MKKILIASMVVGFILTGCNTVKGVGQDVSKVGDVVTNTAEKTQDKL